MGKGVEKEVEASLRKSESRGDWLLLQNCHLVPEWLPQLQRFIMDEIAVS